MLLYNDDATRAAYVAGASDAAEAAYFDLPPSKVCELEHWLAELKAWTGGKPPEAPHLWPIPLDEETAALDSER